MKPIQNSPIAKRAPEKTVMAKPCRHTRVRVVAREEDVEFVECQECGDVFEASEFKDMAIEENIRPEEA
jgi:Zn ribbon nucleic-acid-binding protein